MAHPQKTTTPATAPTTTTTNSTLTAAEKHQRATARLGEARARLATLEADANALTAERDAERQQLTTAEQVKAKAAASLKPLSEALAQAEALRILAGDTADEAEAQTALEQAQEEMSAAMARLGEARALVESLQAAHATAEQGRSTREETLTAERQASQRVVDALERATHEAHAALGRETVATLRARHAALDETRQAATQMLGEVDAAEEAFYAEARTALADWPDLARAALDLQPPTLDPEYQLWRAASTYFMTLLAVGGQVGDAWLHVPGPVDALFVDADELRAMVNGQGYGRAAVQRLQGLARIGEARRAAIVAEQQAARARLAAEEKTTGEPAQ